MENCLVGQRFGRWVVSAEAASAPRAGHWVCQCDCGTVRAVRGYSLLKGLSRSCGCIATERAVILGRTVNRKHGHSLSSKRRSRTYVSWEQMLQRAKVRDDGTKLAYSYAHVAVCDRWRDFSAFLADMGERPAGMSLDRIDNERGYEPGNCRWATPSEQIANQRARVNRWSDRSNKAHRIGDYL